MTTTSRVPEYGEHLSQRRFSLCAEDRFWMVESGTVDVFAVKLGAATEPAGSLRHLVRVQAGQAIFAVPPRATSFELIARMGPDTNVSVYSISQDMNFSLSGERGQLLLTLVEDWIAKFATAIVSKSVPQQYRAVGSGDTVVTADEKCAVVPATSVSWIEHLEGQSFFLGEECSVIAESHVFPVTAASWIELQPNSRVCAVDAHALMREQALVASVARFHSLLIAHLERTLRAVEEDERLRRGRKAQNDLASLHFALKELASPLKGGNAVRGSQWLDTPLFKVLQAIGTHTGIQFRPHPDMLCGKAVTEPVAAIAAASGVRVRRVALKGEWWRHPDHPLLLWYDSNEQPIALLPSGRHFSLFDPRQAEAEEKLVDAATAGLFHPFAYSFYRPFSEKSIGIVDLIGFGVHGCRRELLVIALMGAFSGLLATAVPIATGVLFDSIIPGAQRSQLLLICSLLLLVGVASSMSTLARENAVLRLEGKMDFSIQSAVWDKLLKLPVRFFRDYASGDLADRSMGITQIRRLLTSTTLSSMLSGFFSVFSACLLFYYSPTLALIAVAMTAIAFLFTVAAAYAQLRLERRSWTLSGLIDGVVLEFISGVAKLRVAGAEKRAFSVWVKYFSAQKKLDRSVRRIVSSVMVFNAVYPVACLAAIFVFYQQWQSQPGNLTTGHFLAFVAAFTQFLGAVLSLGGSLISALAVVPLYERTAPILQTLPEVRGIKSDPGDLTGRIEAVHLRFRYRADTPLVIDDASFSILPGQFVAFVGPSGCGKSTLLRLLLAFDQPESGAVFYDGQDLADIDVQAVRRKMGVVLQSSTLTTGTILENIIGVTTELGADAAMEAARMAGLEEDIRRLPMGLYTHIREGGVGLSGGQRQRILIARALASRPRIMFLDEASSALDNKTQTVVGESLKSLKSTRIVIAHRLSTIVEADSILVMERGRIVEQGSYEQLIAKGGLFGELAKRQIA